MDFSLTFRLLVKVSYSTFPCILDGNKSNRGKVSVSLAQQLLTVVDVSRYIPYRRIRSKVHLGQSVNRYAIVMQSFDCIFWHRLIGHVICRAIVINPHTSMSIIRNSWLRLCKLRCAVHGEPKNFILHKNYVYLSIRFLNPMPYTPLYKVSDIQTVVAHSKQKEKYHKIIKFFWN